MHPSRFIAVFTALALVPTAWAQESAESSGSSGASGSSGSAGSGGASSSFGSTPLAPAPASVTPSTPMTPGESAPGTSSSPTGFGTGLGTGTPAQSGQAAGTEIPGMRSTPPPESPTTFSISTGYGRAPEVFVSGEGRLARPKFQTRISGSVGFDDNIFQTPTKARGTDDIVIRQQISAEIPDQIVLVPIPETGPVRLTVPRRAPQQRYRQVVIPGQKAQFEEIVIPGTPKPKRKASAVSRASFGFDTQFATRRTVFTVDFNANADYYWNRPTDKAEYNGSLALRFLHRITPRLQTTVSVDASYLSQPDLTQINTPTTVGEGNYLTLNAKADLSYRWTPRFSTVASIAYNQLSYEDKTRQGGDYGITTFGLELRYLWSPQFTAVLEGRYTFSQYPNAPGLDSHTYYALIGLDLSLSRRAFASLRVGESVREFEEAGDKSSSPYLEASLNYQLGKASVLSWNNRFGFEESPSPTTDVLSFRSGLSITHFFGPRLRGSLGVNGFIRNSKDDTTDLDLTETTLDTSLSILYTLSRYWTFNLNYSYTTLFVDPGENDYFRNRVFAGFDYSF